MVGVPRILCPSDLSLFLAFHQTVTFVDFLGDHRIVQGSAQTTIAGTASCPMVASI